MQQFIEKYRDQVLGTLSGFDRLVLRGSPLRLNHSFYDPIRNIVVAKGMEEYLWQNGVLFKNYGAYVRRVSERVKRRSLKPFQESSRPIVFLRDPKLDKDLLARQIAAQHGISCGLVCAISALEPSPTFDYTKSRIARRIRPAHVLYHYQIHPQLGWMYARIQTWFPFNIQIGLNGREWLSRQMDRAGMPYTQSGNCFTWIEDFARAQKWMNHQLETDWAELLNGFAQQLNPLHDQVFEKYPTDYYWTCYQSEWATDIVFRDAAFLKRLMALLMRHGMLSFASADVLRFFGKRVNQSGKIPANFHGELQSNCKEYDEGERLKYWMEGNSAKCYDKAYALMGSVLRAAETTINNPRIFRVDREKQDGDPNHPKRMPMRKGIIDLVRRAEISQKTNERLIDALASVDDTRSVEELTAGLQQPTIYNGRRVRALRPWGEDKLLLAAINRGDFLIHGFRNRDLQALLYSNPSASAVEQRRRSAAISRKLRILRAHGVIEKVPHTHLYHVAQAARTTLIAILTTARTSLHQINELSRRAA
jgi:hypothetical protein